MDIIESIDQLYANGYKDGFERGEVEGAITVLNWFADRLQSLIPAGEAMSRAELLAMIDSKLIDLR